MGTDKARLGYNQGSGFRAGWALFRGTMLRFSTAGESHGEALVALVSGLPAGVPVDQEFVNRELWRRQQGYGRGGRMRIEKDTAHILSGVRHGKTIGSPIAMTLANRDWKNWEEILPVGAGEAEKHKAVASPRPGHADLAGSLKYDFQGCTLCAGTGERTGERGARGVRSHGEAVAARAGLFYVREPCGSRGTTRSLGRDARWAVRLPRWQAKDDVVLGCVDDQAAEARMKAEVDLGRCGRVTRLAACSRSWCMGCRRVWAHT